MALALLVAALTGSGCPQPAKTVPSSQMLQGSDGLADSSQQSQVQQTSSQQEEQADCFSTGSGLVAPVC